MRHLSYYVITTDVHPNLIDKKISAYMENGIETIETVAVYILPPTKKHSYPLRVSVYVYNIYEFNEKWDPLEEKCARDSIYFCRRADASF